MDSVRRLVDIRDEDSYLLASFFVTDETALRKLVEQWSRRDKDHKSFHGRTKDQTESVSSTTFGGSVALLDPSQLSAGLIRECPSPVATGLAYDDISGLLYVGSNKWIRTLVNGVPGPVVGNRLFNDVHGLELTEQKTLLVTSTGIDGLLEIDPRNPQDLCWVWLATENGYVKTPRGEVRSIDCSKNYQEISTTTPEHTTHLNSTLCYGPGKVLATLFHQGELIEIDKSTGQTRTLLSGLVCPHSIRRRRDGYIISDTRNNCVLLLDGYFNVITALEKDFDWVQDCIESPIDDTFLVADSNNYRICRLNKNGDLLESLNFGFKKIYTFYPIKGKDAKVIFGI